MQVAEAVKDVAGTVRENVVLRAAAAVSSSRGYVATYIHNVLAPGCGTMCSAVALEHDSIDLSKEVPGRIAEFGKHVSMQVRSDLYFDMVWLPRDFEIALFCTCGKLGDGQPHDPYSEDSTQHESYFL